MLNLSQLSENLDALGRTLCTMVNDPEQPKEIQLGDLTLRLDARRERKALKYKNWFASVNGGPEIELGPLTWAAATFVAGYELAKEGAPC